MFAGAIYNFSATMTYCMVTVIECLQLKVLMFGTRAREEYSIHFVCVCACVSVKGTVSAYSRLDVTKKRTDDV